MSRQTISMEQFLDRSAHRPTGAAGARLRPGHKRQVTNPSRMSPPSGRLMREIPEHDRPRERFERLGSDQLTDAELLAILLRTGRKGVNVVQLAEDLIQHFGDIEALSEAEIGEIAKVDGLGRAKAVTVKAALALRGRVKSRAAESRPLKEPSDIYALMAERVRFKKAEVLFGLALDSKLRLI